MSGAEDAVALKILHTADWHLGKRFRSFTREEDARKLMRVRLAVVEQILLLANRDQVRAVLCAGDLFDSAQPEEPWWRELATHLTNHGRSERPIVLLPGNHDPLRPGSVYASEHPFRQALPPWVHVVDRDDFTLPLGDEAVIHAVPCRSQYGQSDPTELLPRRAEGDPRIRIGVVHGQTLDIEGHQRNYPIDPRAAAERGFDYLALGDTHAFRRVDAGGPPVLYPGAPEPGTFGEPEAGSVALVFFPRARREPRIQRQNVGRYVWREHTCSSIEAVRGLRDQPNLEHTVLRLKLDLTVSLPEELELGEILTELQGNDARTGRVAVLEVERCRVDVSTAELADLVPRLPAVLQSTVRRLQELAAGGGPERAAADRALRHVYQLVCREVAP